MVIFFWPFDFSKLPTTSESENEKLTQGKTPENFSGSQSFSENKKLAILPNGQKISLLLAETPLARARGLSDTKVLPEDQAMLFVFQEAGIYAFWMKDMLFAIDIIWLDEFGEIVFVVENATPESYPKNFLPDKPARFVLEATTGFVSKNSLKVGERIVLPEI